MNLVDKTKEVLVNRPRTLTLKKIEGETGIKISWLQAFSNNRIDEPSAIKIETLYEFLTGNKLIS